MIDWMTLHIDAEHLGADTLQQLSAISDKIMRITPEGEISWCTSTFHSLRSDMNGLSYSFTGLKLTIAGSPASVMNSNNVFGSNDLIYCFNSMINFFVVNTGIQLNRNVLQWRCTRIDYTVNLYVGSQENVKIALETLKNTNTRGDNVERRHTTIYWNKSSHLRCGKAYNKYLHAKKCLKAYTHFYSDEELHLVKGVLRFELKLGREWFNRLDKHWSSLTEADLHSQHESFFANILGSIEVTNMSQLLEQLYKVAPTETRALNAYRTFQLIQSIGYKATRESMAKSTWYDHQKLLLSAGLCKSDIQTGDIVPFRRTKVIEMIPVNSWDDLKLVVGQ